ncbi:hypothetical protein DFH09DRAFT_1071989 [Mycena vulgaris]|nr:hypothetical protein DFH09DRAFT_1071989 [Mycena vulgaris]
MDLDVPLVACVESGEDHALDYGDEDDDMDDGEYEVTLPSGSASPTRDGTGYPQSKLLEDNLTQVSRADPMRGGGLVMEEVATKAGHMCAHQEVRAMALEGTDTEEEKKILRRIKEKKWLLNKNLYVPECRGNDFDPNQVFNEDELAALKCEICEEYTRHVGDDFARGDGSLKAVLQLRDLYMLADARINNKVAEQSIRRLEVANAVAEQLNEDKDRQLELAKTEKLLAVQELDTCNKKLEDAWDDIKFLEDKGNQLKSLIDELSFPERPHKKPRNEMEGTPGRSERDEDVTMNEAEPVTTKEPLVMDNGPRTTSTPSTKPTRRVQPPQSQLSNYAILAPPLLEVEPNVDQRGFPMDVAIVNAVIKVLNTGMPYYVYVFRMFYLWSYCRAIKASDRTPAQQRAIDIFVMFDWFANLLTSIGRDIPAQKSALNYFHNLRCKEVGYNPMLLAQLIQFRKWTDISGCPFADDAWTLNMRRVRGLNLLDVLSMRRRNIRDEEGIKVERIRLEKVFLHIFCMPGLCKRLLKKNGVAPASAFVARHWDEELEPVTKNTVAVAIVECGVTVDMINDAFEFGQQWVYDCLEKPEPPPGWTREELEALQHQPTWGKPPSGLFPAANDLFLCRPDVPWHPELVGLKRAPGSKIQFVINKGLTRSLLRNEHLLEQVNPFRKEECHRENEAAITRKQQSNAVAGTSHQVALPAALVNKRALGMPRGVIRTAVLRCEMMMFREGGGGETDSRGFRGGFNVDKSWSYSDGVARKVCTGTLGEEWGKTLAQELTDYWLKWVTSRIWDVDSLGRVSGLEHVPTWMNLPAYCRFPSSIRRELGGSYFVSQRAYPGGFPWVEPVSRKVRTVGGIQDVWGARALELCDILREEVVGGAVGVVRGGFPREGAQRVRFPEEYPNADSCSPNRVIVSCQVRHSRVGARRHTQSVWDPHSGPRAHLRSDMKPHSSPAALSVDMSMHVAPSDPMMGMQVTYHESDPESFAANMQNFDGFTDALERAGIATAPLFQYGEAEYDANVITDGWTAIHIATAPNNL